MRRLSDLCSFVFRAVVAPEIVFAERLKFPINWNDGRTGGIERYGLNLVARDTRLLDGCARGFGERAHVIMVRLSGVFGILALAMQRIICNRGSKHAAFTVHNGGANAEGSEIYASNDGHGFVLFSATSATLLRVLRLKSLVR